MIISRESLNHKNILGKIRTIYQEHYQNDNIELIQRVINDVIDLFSGKKKGFLQCDTGYHDLLHTLQVIPPFIGIIDGRNKSKDTPKISKDIFNLGIIAVLLHDTGYIKTEDDTEGTGGNIHFFIYREALIFQDIIYHRWGLKTIKSIVSKIVSCVLGW